MFFRKKKSPESELEKHLRDLKLRKINYVDDGFDSLGTEMNSDPKSIMRLKPVNYYAIKHSYILARLYSSEDMEENYVQFFRFEGEHQEGKTGIYALDRELTARVLAKVGIII